jgi:hypothetical protein
MTPPSDSHDQPARVASATGRSISTNEVDLDQIVERLQWTPKQRLDYLLDMLAFEDRARHARRVS